jgi:ubiquinone/menaquinone biosynthesis C-methylase UbiE
MTKISLPATIVLALCAVAGSAQVAHQHHPPQSAAEYAGVLDDPSRDAWQMPHQVVMALKLKPKDAVADIGAGTGYFARRFALHAAKVYAVDIDEALLAIAAKDAPAGLTTVLATPEDARLGAGSVDVVFFCDVLHHIQGRSAYLQRLRPALRKGGRIVVVDFQPKSLPVGSPPEMKLAEDTVIAEFRAAGFHLRRRETFLPYQYFLEFGL